MRLSMRVACTVPASIALAAAVAAPAWSATYPPSNPKCTVTPSNATQGSTVSIVGVGFTAGATVGVQGSGAAVVVATTGTADSNGSVKVAGKAGAPGSGTFTLSSGTASATCSVKTKAVEAAATTAPAPAVQPAQALPNTGASNIGLEVGLGAVLLVGGAGLLVLGRRRTN